MVTAAATGAAFIGLIPQIGTTPPVALAATVYTVTGIEMGGLFHWPVDEHLQGVLCKSPNVCTAVDYPASVGEQSVDEGVAAVQEDVTTMPGHKIVYRYSQG